MLHHDVCEKVVARDTAVFIRSLAEHQIRLCVRTVPCVSAGPEAGGFNEYGCGLMQIKFYIPGFTAVFAQSIGYVRRDMNLAAPNVPCFALFAAIERRHPRIPRSGSVHLFCMISGRVQRICAIQAQIFCGCFIILQEEREHKQVCIPEVTALIPCMGQTSCADGNGRIMCGAACHKLKHRIAQTGLQFFIGKRSAAILPCMRPRDSMRAPKRVETPITRSSRNALIRITACTDADQFFDYQRLSGSCMSGQRTGDFCTAVLHDSLRKFRCMELDFLLNA